MSLPYSYSVKGLVTLDRRVLKKKKIVNSEAQLQYNPHVSSIDDSYIGKRVTEMPDEAFMVKIGPRNWANEVTDLDLESAKESLEQLRMTAKPKLSKKAWTRLSNKNRSRLPSAPEDLTDSRGDPGKEDEDGRDKKQPATANGQLPGYQGSVPVIKEETSSGKEEHKMPLSGCPSPLVSLR